MSSTNSNNPLVKHFRQPSIYLKLPSGGRFWPEGSIELSLTGEIPVYPMTIKDELILKTPDALINGSSIVEMIRSCCPSIKDPWLCPVVDVDAILIAIRLASYGNEMEFTSRCPHCKEDNDSAIDLRVVLDNIKPINYSASTNIDNLIFSFKPQSFAELNQVSQFTFEQQKLVSAITNSEIPQEEKTELFRQGFESLTNLNLETIASCIEYIEVDGQKVADREQIKEFLENTTLKNFEAIKSKIEDTVLENKPDSLKMTCNHCEQEYDTDLEFNQSNFFV